MHACATAAPQVEGPREAAEVGAVAPPVDVSTTGSAAESVPQPVTTSTGQSTLGKVGDVALGAAEGIGALAVGAAKFVALNALTFGGYGTYGIGHALWTGYQEDGVLGALNAGVRRSLSREPDSQPETRNGRL